MYKLLLIGLVFFLQGCSLLTEDKKIFQGELQKFHVTENDGLDGFVSAPAELIYVTHNQNDQIKRLEIIQGQKQIIVQPNQTVHKKPIHGSFTLETTETDWGSRLEGQVNRRFLSNPIVEEQKKECTFSGICEKEIEKEVKECHKIANIEQCEIKKEKIKERGYYTDCPGIEVFSVTQQQTIYDLQLMFFNPDNNRSIAGFQGSTDELTEETSRVQIEPCN